MNTTLLTAHPPSTRTAEPSALSMLLIDNVDRQRTEQPWRVEAACATAENAGDLFFSDELTDIAAAKRICAQCPVIAPCLEAALTNAEPCGVWGGQLFANGKIQMVKRRRGRPPKVPRPEDQLPEIPIPEHLQRLIA